VIRQFGEADAARLRWRGAEDQLYPTLIADPSRYQKALEQVRAIVVELRRRADDLPALLAAEAAAGEVLAAACPGGSILPADLLVRAACAMRARALGGG
jgi:hypothetical protein